MFPRHWQFKTQHGVVKYDSCFACILCAYENSLPFKKPIQSHLHLSKARIQLGQCYHLLQLEFWKTLPLLIIHLQCPTYSSLSPLFLQFAGLVWKSNLFQKQCFWRLFAWYYNRCHQMVPWDWLLRSKG